MVGDEATESPAAEPASSTSKDVSHEDTLKVAQVPPQDADEHLAAAPASSTSKDVSHVVVSEPLLQDVPQQKPAAVMVSEGSAPKPTNNKPPRADLMAQLAQLQCPSCIYQPITHCLYDRIQCYIV